MLGSSVGSYFLKPGPTRHQHRATATGLHRATRKAACMLVSRVSSIGRIWTETRQALHSFMGGIRTPRQWAVCQGESGDRSPCFLQPDGAEWAVKGWVGDPLGWGDPMGPQEPMASGDPSHVRRGGDPMGGSGSMVTRRCSVGVSCESIHGITAAHGLTAACGVVAAHENAAARRSP